MKKKWFILNKLFSSNYLNERFCSFRTHFTLFRPNFRSFWVAGCSKWTRLLFQIIWTNWLVHISVNNILEFVLKKKIHAFININLNEHLVHFEWFFVQFQRNDSYLKWSFFSVFIVDLKSIEISWSIKIITVKPSEMETMFV